MWNNVNGRDRKVTSYLSGDLVFYFSPKIMLMLSRLRVSKKLKPFFFQGANLLSIFRNTLLFLDIHKVRLSVTRNIELFDVFFYFFIWYVVCSWLKVDSQLPKTFTLFAWLKALKNYENALMLKSSFSP